MRMTRRRSLASRRPFTGAVVSAMPRRFVKIVLCSLTVILLTLSFFIFSELSFVEKLEDNQVLPVARGKASTTASTPCPRFGVNVSDSELYTLLRRRKQYELRVEKSTRELWWYVRKRLKSFEHSTSYLNATLLNFRDQYISLQSRLMELNKGLEEKPFQLNWMYWQKNISIELTLLMKERLHYLQNPPNCKSARKLLCHVAKSCGFGCQIHHVSFCFIMAYATQRTLILDSTNWRYSPRGWDAVFQPISLTCTDIPSGMCVHATGIIALNLIIACDKLA